MALKSLITAGLGLAAMAAAGAQPFSAQALELLEPGKLQVATEGTYPPFSMQDGSGNLDGLEVRVGKELAKQGSDNESAADMKGRNVGALVASTWTELAEEHGATPRTYKAESDALQDLADGNVDAVITDSIAASYAIRNSRLLLVMTEDYVSRIQKSFAFKSGNPNLVQAINKAKEPIRSSF